MARIFFVMAETQGTRLDRIEGKIDKLHEGFVSLARIEERMISQFKTNEQVESQLLHLKGEFNKRIDGLQEIINSQAQTIFINSQITSKINKGFWLIVFGIPTGTIGLLFFMLRS